MFCRLRVIKKQVNMQKHNVYYFKTTIVFIILLKETIKYFPKRNILEPLT